MKAMLKDGSWRDVDTSALFKDAVVVEIDGKYYDESRDVIQIRDDVRTKETLYRCNFCGFVGNEEAFKKHLENNEKQSKLCEHCKYWKYIIDDTEQERCSQTSYNVKEEITENSYVSVSHTVYRTKYIKGCSYCRYSTKEPIDCRYRHCKDTEPENLSFGYFQINPFGNLFSSWDFNPIGDIISRKLKCGYNFEFNVVTGDVKLYNTRRSFEFNADIEMETTNGNRRFYVPYSYQKCYADGIVGTLFCQARDMIDLIVNSMESYNSRVTNDKWYTNPDGTPLNEAVIDGNVFPRPKPLTYTFGAKEREY